MIYFAKCSLTTLLLASTDTDGISRDLGLCFRRIATNNKKDALATWEQTTYESTKIRNDNIGYFYVLKKIPVFTFYLKITVLSPQ